MKKRLWAALLAATLALGLLTGCGGTAEERLDSQIEAGDALVESGQYEEAIEAYDKALALCKNISTDRVYYSRAIKHDKALAMIRVDQTSSEVYELLFEAYREGYPVAGEELEMLQKIVTGEGYYINAEDDSAPEYVQVIQNKLDGFINSMISPYNTSVAKLESIHDTYGDYMSAEARSEWQECYEQKLEDEEQAADMNRIINNGW